MNRIQRRLDDALNNPGSRAFAVVNDTLAVFTLLSIFSLILETVEALSPYQFAFTAIEYIAVFFFTLEYLARLIHAKKKRYYVLGFFGIVDLLAILPSYLLFANFTFLKSVRVLRILRLLRMVRIAKIAALHRRRNRDINLYRRVHRLNLEIYFFTLFSALVVFGSALYVVESHQIAAANIPLAMIWIAKVVMGGVAQFSPSTVWGDIIIVLSRFTGLLLLGLLIYIMGNTINRTLFGSVEVEARRSVRRSRSTVHH